MTPTIYITFEVIPRNQWPASSIHCTSYHPTLLITTLTDWYDLKILVRLDSLRPLFQDTPSYNDVCFQFRGYYIDYTIIITASNITGSKFSSLAFFQPPFDLIGFLRNDENLQTFNSNKLPLMRFIVIVACCIDQRFHRMFAAKNCIVVTRI